MDEASVESIPRLYRKIYMADGEPMPGDCYIGQLTQQGLEQHLNLGAQFRDIYVTSTGCKQHRSIYILDQYSQLIAKILLSIHLIYESIVLISLYLYLYI